MFSKIILMVLVAVSQGASNEPWWIQMFFPGVSFTGKYHPSNYKAEKSPLYPDYAQNPNDIWSPAYWMPYKMAYSQYWIDLINNNTEAEKQQLQEAQGQTGQNWDLNNGNSYGENNHYGQNTQDQGKYIIKEWDNTLLIQQLESQAQDAHDKVQQVANEADVQQNAQNVMGMAS